MTVSSCWSKSAVHAPFLPGGGSSGGERGGEAGGLRGELGAVTEEGDRHKTGYIKGQWGNIFFFNTFYSYRKELAMNTV